MFLDIFPDFLIGSFRFRSGHVQFVHLQIDRDLLVDIQFGQSTYHLDMLRMREHIHRGKALGLIASFVRVARSRARVTGLQLT